MAVIALWESVVQLLQENGEKIGISGALFLEKTCYNKLSTVNSSQDPRKREKSEIKQSVPC